MSEFATPRRAASVVLVRKRADASDLEVFLLRRHRGASFMSSAFVFPGGAADPGEDDARVTAARELFEEAGVLLTREVVPAAKRESWRAALLAGEGTLGDMLTEADAELDLDAMHFFAHWITPSVEKKRFSARFYVAELPAGQTPSFDNRETVDEIWTTPRDALARAGELKLPPPQVRTFSEMRAAAESGFSALLAEAQRREAAQHVILPRFMALDTGSALLLPWDPDYETHGQGDSRPMPPNHALAEGPSRFVLEDGTWKNVYAPGSAQAG